MTPALPYPPSFRRPIPSASGLRRTCRRLDRALHNYSTGLLLTAAALAAGFLLEVLLRSASGPGAPSRLLEVISFLGGLTVLGLIVGGLVFVLVGMVKCSAALNRSRLKALAFPAAYCSVIAAIVLVPASIATVILDPSPIGNLVLGVGALFAVAGHCCFLVLLRKLARGFRDKQLGRTVAVYIGVWVSWCIVAVVLSFLLDSRPAADGALTAVVGVLGLVVALALYLWLVALVRRVRDLAKLTAVHGSLPSPRGRGASA
jgi:uncharacterized membrane protein